MSKETKVDEIAKAKELLLAEQNKKIQACNDEIKAVLDKYGLTIDARAIVQLIPK